MEDHQVVLESRQASATSRILGVAALLCPELEEHRRPEVLDLVVGHAAGQDVHEPVRGVLVLRHDEAQAVEVGLRLLGGAQVHGLAARAEQQHVVEEREEGVAGLVDDHGDGHAQVRHLLQGVDDLQRGGGVQARCGLVQPEQRGARGELQADVHALALAAADAALLHAADEAGLDVADLHHGQHVLHDVVDLLGRGRRRVPQLRGEVDVLAHRELRVHHVVLRHKAHDRLERGHVHLLLVEPDLARRRAVGRLAAQHVHEGRLAGARGPHDGGHAPGLELPRDALQHRPAVLQLQPQLLEADGDGVGLRPHAAEVVAVHGGGGQEALAQGHSERLGAGHHVGALRPGFLQLVPIAAEDVDQEEAQEDAGGQEEGRQVRHGEVQDVVHLLLLARLEELLLLGLREALPGDASELPALRRGVGALVHAVSELIQSRRGRGRGNGRRYVFRDLLQYEAPFPVAGIALCHDAVILTSDVPPLPRLDDDVDGALAEVEEEQRRPADAGVVREGLVAPDLAAIAAAVRAPDALLLVIIKSGNRRLVRPGFAGEEFDVGR
mmetsp:Transcript_58886/g.189373  ORF Transcript_58886/g.189373 Transcript_58886/m.189373 type:complete len:554 (-) Transcript_58886:56-1717(-)